MRGSPSALSPADRRSVSDYTPRRAATLYALAAAACTALVYLPTLANELVWDDVLDIASNPHVHSLRAALEYFRQLHGVYYRPLVFLTFAFEFSLWGARPLGYHATNVLVHALNVFLVVRLAVHNRLSFPGALLAGLLFGLHPLQTDAVAYVSGRTDLLMTTGALTTYAILLASWPAAWRGGLAAVTLAVAILSKETGYMLVPLLAWWASRSTAAHGGTASSLTQDDGSPRPLARALALGAPSALVFVALLLTRPAGLPWPGMGQYPSINVAAAGHSLVTYLSLLVCPRALQIDRLTANTGAAGPAVLVVLLAAVLTGAALWAARRSSGSVDWILWSVAFYLPASNMVPLYPAIADQWAFTPEHNLYAPMAGLAVLCGAVAQRILGRLPSPYRRIVGAAVMFVIVALAMGTRARLPDWRDGATLFRSAVAAGSVSPRVWFNHGNELLRAGALTQSVEAYRTAARLAPQDPQTWANLGVALQRQNQIDAALDAYARATALAPSSPVLFENLGTAQLRAGDLEGARASFTRALALDPERVLSRNALAAMGRPPLP